MNYVKQGELGVVTASIGPKENNPRNSEGTFLELQDGEIIFVYSRFRGDSSHDEAFADLSLIRSTDGGRTWGEDEIILTYQGEDGVNMMSPALLMMNNGDVGLFYLVRLTYKRTQIFLRRSSDKGKTWGERVVCTPQEDFFVMNNDRVVRLASGRIIVPVASHRTGDNYMDGRSLAMFFYSDDDGATWKCARDKCAMPYSSFCYSGLQEPGVLELAPGILWGWARTDLGNQYEMFSMDEGDSWTACQPSRFTSPNSPLSMRRDSDGTIYAVWNPIPIYNGRFEAWEPVTGGRFPLVIAASRDNGKTFTHPTIVEGDETRGYCYTAILFTKDAMLLAYCAGNKEDGHCLTRTRIRRIEKSQLEEFCTGAWLNRR